MTNKKNARSTSKLAPGLLEDLLAGTAAVTGPPFFAELARGLSRAVASHMAWITEFTDGDPTLNALAIVIGDDLQTNYRYDLKGTPCEAVVREAKTVHHVDGVQEAYPGDTDLQSLGVKSYLGVPLLHTDGSVLGHLAVMDREPMPEQPIEQAVFKIFAARAAAELQRIRAEKEQAQLKVLLQQANQALTESEGRFRDLFEEAPIAYVHEDLESKFIRANRTALQILGLTPEDVPHTYGKSLVPDTPEAQKRVQVALETIAAGKDAAGVVLQLQRKDNGELIWIQWWSSPSPDGTFTRTMFIDVTDKVRMGEENELLEAQNSFLRQELQSDHTAEFIGESESVQNVFADLDRVAQTDTTVLILGETGTGKELAARAVHTASPRRGGPLIKVNCAALPSSLIEAELFGHEKGAFTGATKARDGRFALADGGTIFLDEIGEIPIEVQVKLLRVLQEGEIERVGSSKTQKVDVRVIAATNRDLLQAIQNGEFREDLYYRLAVFPLEMPPLRARDHDILLLANAFVERHSKRIGREIKPVTDEQATRLRSYPWPGNVRELQNVIERAAITSVDGYLNLDRALPEVASTQPQAVIDSTAILTADEMLELEKINIVRALQASDWRVAGEGGAAAILGINPSTLSSRMKSLGISRPT
jgi:formate hydrogenlyase transcriptional activator